MSFDVNVNTHLIVDFADFLNLFKEVHLQGIKIVARRLADNVETGEILDAASIEEARLAIWNLFSNFIQSEEYQWVSPDDSWEAGFIAELAEIVGPLRIEYLGNPRKGYGYKSWDLDDGLQIAFECEDLFETVMSPKGQTIGKLFQQSGITSGNEISPTTWASAN